MKINPLKIASLFIVSLAILAGCGDDSTPPAPTVSTFSQISAGGRHIYNARVENAHTCGISKGMLWCWGANGDGQLGTGDRVPHATPVQVGSDDTWTSVSTGGGFTCGINAGKLYCWGANRVYGKYDYSTSANPFAFEGILGLGNSFNKVDSVDTPTQVGEETDWTQVSTGMNHTCGLRGTTNHTLWCWGFAGDSSSTNTDKLGLNNATPVSKNVPTRVGVAADWITISAGQRGSTYGIRGTGEDGTLWHFGEGFGSYGDVNTPTQVDSFTNWRAISTGAWNACGLRGTATAQTLWCWGSNSHGEAASGAANVDTNVNGTTQVGTSDDWESIDMSNGYACGIRSNNLYCWGRNYAYELGIGKNLTSISACENDSHTDDQWNCGAPVLVDSALNWASVSTGNLSTCGILSNGDLYCWGGNYWNQTGIEAPDATVVLSPTKIN